MVRHTIPRLRFATTRDTTAPSTTSPLDGPAPLPELHRCLSWLATQRCTKQHALEHIFQRALTTPHDWDGPYHAGTRYAAAAYTPHRCILHYAVFRRSTRRAALHASFYRLQLPGPQLNAPLPLRTADAASSARRHTCAHAAHYHTHHHALHHDLATPTAHYPHPACLHLFAPHCNLLIRFCGYKPPARVCLRLRARADADVSPYHPFLPRMVYTCDATQRLWIAVT